MHLVFWRDIQGLDLESLVQFNNREVLSVSYDPVRGEWKFRVPALAMGWF